MRIYSMTATFGKLEHATLKLQPGFNPIHAPNEWGKSTWCAFLAAMLYGLDTRAKSTKTTLADKERFAPWSGSPMSGRIDLNWNGRDITIERTTKGRVPMGEFRAYETESGIPVAELNAANCGQMLLGVERSVFLRSAFIRLSDLPVTQDEALRRRLNALVTTGDESSAGDRLAAGLKELKNKCRYHKSGLIPQAEAERAGLESQIGELETLELHGAKLRTRLEEVRDWTERLENHKTALAFDAAETDARHVAQARQLRDEAEERLRELDGACARLPEREQVQWALSKLSNLEQEVQALEMEAQMVSEEIIWPEPPEFIEDRTPQEALEKAEADAYRYSELTEKKPLWWILGILLELAGAVAAHWYLLPGLIGVGVGVVVLIAALIASVNRKHAVAELITIYRSEDPKAWVAEAKAYQSAVEKTRARVRIQQENQADLDARMKELDEKINRMTQNRGLKLCRQDWEDALQSWEDLGNASRDLQRVEHQLQTLRSMARTAQPPKYPDDMTYTDAETDRLLSDANAELRQLETRLSQYAGRMEALGDKVLLEKQLDRVNARLQKLEDAYAALTIAQETLAQATLELQRRFAPRISKRAGELMTRMTAGRYDRMQLGEDFSLLSAAGQEDTLHEALWRSDGTVDQLYLALRLAVAGELAPEAPLILDDALVRFDEKRLEAALEILKEESLSRQVILFSCQNREKI